MAKKTFNGENHPGWDFAKLWSNLRLPDLDVTDVITAQKKNIDAINLANKAAVEGWQAITKKQASLWQSTLERGGMVAQDVAAAQGTSDKLAMQAAFATSSIEEGISNVRDAHELVAKTTNKAMDIVSKRIIEGLEEAMTVVGKADRMSTTVDK